MTTALPSSVSCPPNTDAIIPVPAATGQMALHLIPSFANSAANPFVTALTAPLLPAYLDFKGYNSQQVTQIRVTWSVRYIATLQPSVLTKLDSVSV